jgi:hypothetical protein
MVGIKTLATLSYRGQENEQEIEDMLVVITIYLYIYIPTNSFKYLKYILNLELENTKTLYYNKT